MAVNPNPPANPPAAPSNPPAPPAAGPTNTDAPAGDPNPAAPAAEPMIPKSRFDEINNKLKAAEKANSDREAAAAQAEADRAKASGEWQTLAEKHEKRAKDLEPQAAKADRFEAALTSILATERTGLAPHILTLLDRMDPAEQLEYIAANRDVLKPAAAASGTTTAAQGSAVPATPKPDNGKSLSEQESKDAQARSSSWYQARV